jgi:PAS domain S-box-containing protein
MLTAANRSETYYLRIQTAGSMYIQLNMWSKDAFVSAIGGPLLTHGVLYGIVFLGAICSLMNAIFMRERMYVFVALGILSSSGYSLGINGFGYQFVWPNNVWLQTVNIPFFLNCCFGFSLLFSREFLQLNRVAPRLDIAIILCAAFCLICAVLSLILPYATMIRITSVASITMSLLGFGAGLVSFVSGYKAARFYVLGWLAVVVGATTFGLKSLGVLPSNLFTVWAQEFGFACVAFFLTISQSDHFFQARRAHEAAQSTAMDAIRNAEQKYRSLFENAIEGIFQMDIRGRLVSANKAFARILGRQDVNALLGQEQKPFSLLCLSDTERDRFKSILDSNQQTVSDFQTSFKLSTGEERWISVSLQPVRSRPEEITHFEGAIADITETKKRLLAEKQRHMAEASTEAKSLFLANMSHEIRTPMNAIIGFTDLALERNRDPQLNDFLRKTRMASGNLLGIINDILDFSKIEAGKLEIEETPFSLQDVLNNLKNIVSVTVASKNLGFNVLVDEDIPDQLIGDPLRIGQVLLNLTNNAIKFTQQGQVTVEIELRSLNKKEMAIELVGRIRDTGIGIPAETLKNLFSSFTQADQSTTRRFGGTGLGLSISKQLVEMMGGTLTVESVVDQGSTFSFTLRCRLQDRRQRINPHFSEPEMPLRVLVVDDQSDAREVLEKALLSLAHHPTCVASAELAIDELRAQQEAGTPYDVLIADWFMPDMDGIRCCQYIQQNEHFIKPRMVIVTGYDLEDAKQQARQVGIDAFMLKPVRVTELSAVLKQVFTDRRSMQDHSSTDSNDEPARYDFTGAKVLLVDDVAMNQELAQVILNKRGFAVTLAGNGQEAVDAVRASRFDLVLMDMQMPVMDGCQATGKIREFDRRLPIIAMTANAMAGDKAKCLAAGMNDYVAKVQTRQPAGQSDHQGAGLTASTLKIVCPRSLSPYTFRLFRRSRIRGRETPAA